MSCWIKKLLTYLLTRGKTSMSCWVPDSNRYPLRPPKLRLKVTDSTECQHISGSMTACLPHCRTLCTGYWSSNMSLSWRCWCLIVCITWHRAICLPCASQPVIDNAGCRHLHSARLLLVVICCSSQKDGWYSAEQIRLTFRLAFFRLIFGRQPLTAICQCALVHLCVCFVLYVCPSDEYCRSPSCRWCGWSIGSSGSYCPYIRHSSDAWQIHWG